MPKLVVSILTHSTDFHIVKAKMNNALFENLRAR